MGPVRPVIDSGTGGVGIFGGTFDPVHNGHLGAALHVRHCFSLALVHLVLASSPPHKRGREVAPAGARMAMLKAAVRDLPGLCASDVELRRNGLSFTIDTIEHFRCISPDPDRLFFILGSDAFADMGTWKRTRDIFRLANIIVMTRPGHDLDEIGVARFINPMLSVNYTYDTQTKALVCPDLKPVRLCRVPEIPVSSTEIRNLIKNGCSVSPLLPGPVETIIREQGLYS